MKHKHFYSGERNPKSLNYPQPAKKVNYTKSVLNKEETLPIKFKVLD
jgi:hypothetical protein